nr:hypothetical protein [Rhodoferax sp.]
MSSSTTSKIQFGFPPSMDTKFIPVIAATYDVSECAICPNAALPDSTTEEGAMAMLTATVRTVATADKAARTKMDFFMEYPSLF